MNNESHQNFQNNEISLWDLLSLFSKNIILIIVIVIISVSIGAIYSFVFKPAEEDLYYFKEIVICDEWDYYPVALDSIYAKELIAFIKEETGKSYIDSMTVKDDKINDDKYEFNAVVYFSPYIDKETAENITDKIVEWHNSIMDDEIQRIIENKKNEVDKLFNQYNSLELEYHNFLAENSTASSDTVIEDLALSSQIKIAYKLLETEALELQDIMYDYSNINAYYLNNITLYKDSSDSKNVWKSNIIIAFILGIIMSIAFILFRESYRTYKKNKNQD